MRTAIITIWLVVLLVCGQAGAIVNFNDGGYHLIDYVINDGVYIDYATPNAGTQIEISSGGWTKENIMAYGTSRIIINGGRIDNTLWSGDNSQIIMNSGIAQIISVDIYSELVMHGGQITNTLVLGSETPAIITGGTIGEIGVNSRLTMSGGIIQNGIGASGSGLMTLIGADFQVNGHNVGYGDHASTWATPGIDPWGHPWLTGTVTGILESGDVINNSFSFYQNGDITFVPEPVTFLMLLTGAFIIRRRKRK